MSYLNGYERCLERSRLSPAAIADPGRHDLSRAPRADTG
jgi:hypothetical protein